MALTWETGATTTQIRADNLTTGNSELLPNRLGFDARSEARTRLHLFNGAAEELA